eukprot:scaffold1819_cov160-Amphora_coffeaeformis.AAC.5
MELVPSSTQGDDQENESSAVIDWTALTQKPKESHLQLNSPCPDSTEIEQATSIKEKYHALQALYMQLSSEENQPTITAAFDQRVDRCLCSQVMRHTPPDDDSVDANNFILILAESLVCLWKKQSTTQTRNESRLRGLEILPYLLSLWNTPHKDSRLHVALLSIFRAWAKIQEGSIKSLLIKTGLIQSLSAMFERNGDTLLWPQGLGLMKDLMFRASAGEKEKMYEHWIDHVTHTLPNDNCADAASACLWNWAVDESIALRMAEHVRLWATMALCQPTFTSQAAQRNTLSTVGSILSVCANRLEESPSPVLKHATWLIAFLLRTMEESDDGDLRRRAVRTIRCLSTCGWGRATLQNHFGNAHGLVQRLTRLLPNRQEEDDTRVQVCLAMKHWLPHLNECWSHVGPYVERSLVKAIQDESSGDKVIMNSMQVLTTCFEFSPWKRGAGCLSDEFFGRLSDILKDHIAEKEYHDLIVSLLHQIASKTNNPDDESCVLGNPKVVDILGLLLSEFEASTTKAIEFIETAVKHEASRKFFVEHDSLLTNLVNVCILSSGDRKTVAKSLLVSLVSDL